MSGVDDVRRSRRGEIECGIRATLDTGAIERGRDAVFTARGVTMDRVEFRQATMAWAGELRRLVPLGGRIFLHGLASPTLAAAYLAGLTEGYVLVPVDPFFPRAWRQTMLEETKPSVILTDCVGSVEWAPVGIEVLRLDDLTVSPPVTWPELRASDPDAAAIVLRTSGSTGAPKTVLVSRSNLAATFATLSQLLKLEPHDRMLATASVSFSSSIRQILYPLWAGAAVVGAHRELLGDNAALLEFMVDRKVTVADLIPSLLHELMHACAENPELTQTARCIPLRLFTAASEPLRAETYRLFRDTLPYCPFINMYGLTETTGIVAAHHLNGPPASDSSSTIPIGQPVGQNRFDVVRDQGGYDNLKVASAQVAKCLPPHEQAGICVTGDVVRREPEDGAWQVVGRHDEQVKINGVRINLAALASELRSQSAILDAAVFVTPTADRPALTVYFVADREIAPSELRQFIISQFPEAAIPSKFFRIHAMPRLPNLKIDRQALLAIGKEPSNVAFLAGASSIEGPITSVLRDIWKKRLGLSELPAEPHFYTLGGDSLIALQILADVKRHFGQRLPPDIFHSDDSLSAMAFRLSRSLHNPDKDAHERI
ncbi:MAG: non-ribosomal peptide synthetase [Hyphomicrobiales bacterium]